MSYINTIKRFLICNWKPILAVLSTGILFFQQCYYFQKPYCIFLSALLQPHLPANAPTYAQVLRWFALSFLVNLLLKDLLKVLTRLFVQALDIILHANEQFL